MRVDNAHLKLFSGGPTMDGSFLFDQSTRSGFATTAVSFTGASSPSVFATGDVDGDGDLDVVTGTGAGHDNQLFLNDSHGVFTLATSGMPAGNADDTRAVALVDVNNDNLLDLIVVNAGTTRVHLNLGLATTGTHAWQGFSTTPATVTTPDARAVAVGDLNGDGNEDLVVGASTGQPVAVLPRRRRRHVRRRPDHRHRGRHRRRARRPRRRP